MMFMFLVIRYSHWQRFHLLTCRVTIQTAILFSVLLFACCPPNFGKNLLIRTRSVKKCIQIILKQAADRKSAYFFGRFLFKLTTFRTISFSKVRLQNDSKI